MMNPMNIMGGGMPPILQQFMQFRNQFQGDPRSQVQSLLNSGRISQEQYNQAVQMANQLMHMMR